jgi:hypothetical protein
VASVDGLQAQVGGIKCSTSRAANSRARCQVGPKARARSGASGLVPRRDPHQRAQESVQTETKPADELYCYNGEWDGDISRIFRIFLLGSSQAGSRFQNVIAVVSISACARPEFPV